MLLSSHYVLLLYPRNLPGPLCVQCPGSQAVQAGVKVRCQAWASESGERGGGITLHTHQAKICTIIEVKAEHYEGQTSFFSHRIVELSKDIQSMAINIVISHILKLAISRVFNGSGQSGRHVSRLARWTLGCPGLNSRHWVTRGSVAGWLSRG